MPFVTEELWQRLPRRADQATPPSIMRAPYPAANPAWRDARAEADMELALAVVGRARGLRSGAAPDQALLCAPLPDEEGAACPAALKEAAAASEMGAEVW